MRYVDVDGLDDKILQTDKAKIIVGEVIRSGSIVPNGTMIKEGGIYG